VQGRTDPDQRWARNMLQRGQWNGRETLEACTSKAPEEGPGEVGLELFTTRLLGPSRSDGGDGLYRSLENSRLRFCLGKRTASKRVDLLGRRQDTIKLNRRLKCAQNENLRSAARGLRLPGGYVRTLLQQKYKYAWVLDPQKTRPNASSDGLGLLTGRVISK